MQIVVIGNLNHQQEFKARFPEVEARFHRTHAEAYANGHLNADCVLFDFMVLDEPNTFYAYANYSPKAIFYNAPFAQLAQVISRNKAINNCNLFGFNGLPTFFNRPLLEVSTLKRESLTTLSEITNFLKVDFRLVEDRVGMVTPRIVSMIINEAYFTLQEGTASKADIDLSMKLGTNYPYGPFEWAEKIGLKYVLHLIEAMYADTKDERYRVCPLLKTEAFLK